jgi:hypothetical protein
MFRLLNAEGVCCFHYIYIGYISHLQKRAPTAQVAKRAYYHHHLPLVTTSTKSLEYAAHILAAVACVTSSVSNHRAAVNYVFTIDSRMASE